MSDPRPVLTPDELATAVDMACDREVLLDQRGRWWGNWRTYEPERAATCRKCGKSIMEGYCLLPEANIKICASHVERRWV